MNKSCEYYIEDVLKNIIDRAINIKRDGSAFNEGLQQGYYEVISHMLNQAETFGINETFDKYLKNFKTEDIVKGVAKSPFKD